MQTAMIILVGATLMALTSRYQSKKAGKPWLATVYRGILAGYQTLLFWMTFICFAFASRIADPQRRIILQLASCLPAGVAIVLQTHDKMRSNRQSLELKRRSEGLCVQCGYDLRRSNDLCPECGLPVPRIIILHNDDIHDASAVMQILADVLGISAAEAGRLTNEVHEQGHAQVFEADPDRAAEIGRKLQARGLAVSFSTRAGMELNSSESEKV